MANMNLVAFTGNLTADPEYRQTTGGTPVCSLRVAVNKRVKRGDSWEDKGVFIPVEIFGNSATTCAQHLRKGSRVAVNGSFDFDQWQDQQTRQNRSKLYVVADNVEFLSPRPAGVEQPAVGQQSPAHQPVQPAPVAAPQPGPVMQPPVYGQPLAQAQHPGQFAGMPAGAPANGGALGAIGGVPAASDDIPF
jgi:single-strand DNA-binding protein